MVNVQSTRSCQRLCEVSVPDLASLHVLFCSRLPPPARHHNCHRRHDCGAVLIILKMAGLNSGNGATQIHALFTDSVSVKNVGSSPLLVTFCFCNSYESIFETIVLCVDPSGWGELGLHMPIAVIASNHCLPQVQKPWVQCIECPTQYLYKREAIAV